MNASVVYPADASHSPAEKNLGKVGPCPAARSGVPSCRPSPSGACPPCPEGKQCDLRHEVLLLNCALAKANTTIRDLSDERDALRFQIDLDRRHFRNIMASGSWLIARSFHYLGGLLTFDLAVIREARSTLGHILLRWTGRENPPVRRKGALLVRRLMDGCSRAMASSRIAGDAPARSSLRRESGAAYESVYQDDEHFPSVETTVRTIAFFLPQFHTFPENDAWWGKGFTEWCNTRKATQRFPGHYQPRVPHADIGYYDLSEVETLKRQVRQAKAHGIDAFCIYYYWFNGKKLMERPLETLLAHPEIDFPFCLCWANENWTRTWDGQEKSVLIQQEYSKENDRPLIEDLARYFSDPRYLRCGGRPVILVYHAKIMPDPDRTFETWRRYCREKGIGEIQIWSCRTFIADNDFRKPVQVDREVEFPPHRIASIENLPPERFAAYKNDGYYYDYSRIIEDVMTERTLADRSPYPIYRCVMMGWDNSCRRATGYSIWQYFSLSSYHSWLRKVIEYTERNFIPGERFLFINAWNEWGEGTYLEPDEKYGYANINTTTRALCNLPVKDEYEVLPLCQGELPSPGKILVHFHCFYPDLMAEFLSYLEHLPFAFDLVVTTDDKGKEERIDRMLEEHRPASCRSVTLRRCGNRGRDVAPLFETCSELLDGYDYIGHFHTKKSPTVAWGAEWRHYLLDNLLGSTDGVKAIFRRFARDKGLGLFFPVPIPTFRDYMNWEGNLSRCRELLGALDGNVSLPSQPLFPVGQMFWARSKAVKALFSNPSVREEAFEAEEGQLCGTLAHAIERIWPYAVKGSGYTSLPAILQRPVRFVHPRERKRLALYVHYSADGIVSACDLFFLCELQTVAEVVFIANGKLSDKSRRALARRKVRILQRANRGYDFGAWRDVLRRTDLGSYDEIVLVNSSILGPFEPFGSIFARMDGSSADFWGMTEFPEIRNPHREEAKWLPHGVIPRHLQSYFLVFRKKAFLSSPFRDFWNSVSDKETLPEVVANYETRLTGLLERAGFKSDVYLKASGRLQEQGAANPVFNAIYCNPMDFIALGFPFLKKSICYYLDQSRINEVIRYVENFTWYPERIVIKAIERRR